MHDFEKEFLLPAATMALDFISAIAFCFLCFLFTFGILYRKRCQQLWEKLGVPGPRPSLISGNLLQLKASGKPYEVMSTWIQEYGPAVGYYKGQQPHILISDLDILKKVMTKDFNNFANRPKFSILPHPLPLAVNFAKDNRWQNMRTLYNLHFRSINMKQIANIVDEKVNFAMDLMVEKLKHEKSLDVLPIFQGVAVDIILDWIFSIKTSCLNTEKDPLLESLRDGFRLSSHWSVDLAYMFSFFSYVINKLVNLISPFSPKIDFIHHFVRKNVKFRRKCDERKADFLQWMLDHIRIDIDGSKILTEDEVVANIITMLLTGFETTSSAMAFTIYQLVVNPDIQDNLYQEVKSSSSYDSILGYSYLDHVLKESLRCFPPVVEFIYRISSQDYSTGTYTIPKGSIVQVPVWTIHHDPKNWPDPDSFKPERFAPDCHANMAAYFPFGQGRRNCIGKKFAEIQMKVMLCKFLTKFRFSMCSKTDHPLTLTCPSGTIAPANGLYVKVELRK